MTTVLGKVHQRAPGHQPSRFLNPDGEKNAQAGCPRCQNRHEESRVCGVAFGTSVWD